MSHASLRCQNVISACRRAGDAAGLTFDLPRRDALPGQEQVRHEVRTIEGLMALARAAEREGQLTMQVSAADFLLLADFYEGTT